MKRIGLFFGSFNPLTNAHVALAKFAVSSDHVDEAWFVLSPANPAKIRKNILADEEARRDMLKNFISHENDERLKLCDIEYELPRPSYTHRTISVLKEKYPDTEFVILCGSDTLAKILTWKTGLDIIKENKFICYQRGDVPESWPDVLLENTRFEQADIPHVSSTLVRGNILSGNAYDSMIPEPIFAYIEAHGLYR